MLRTTFISIINDCEQVAEKADMETQFFGLLLIIIAGNILSIELVKGNKTEEEVLRHHLFGDGRDFRGIIPKFKYINDVPFEISVHVAISHIFDIKASEEEVDMILRVFMVWQNDLLQWNSTTYGIERLAVPSHLVWTPTLSIEENTVRADIGVDNNDTVFLTPDGTNSVALYKNVRLLCEFDACIYPKDKHSCPMTVYMKVYNTSVAIIKRKAVLYSKPKTVRGTGTWKIELGSPNETVIQYPYIEGHYSSALQYKLSLERKPMFYISTTIIPITLLAIICSASTILPAMTGDRIALLITCMLATVVYLDTLFKYLPESSRSFPLIFMWVVFNLATTTIQIVLACICLNWANKEEKKKKPGKKMVLIIFYLLKYSVLIIPIVCNKIYLCIKNRKKKIDISNPEQTEESQAECPQSCQSIPVSQDKAIDNDNEEKVKSFKNAVKILDMLAMVLSVVSLSVIPLLFMAVWGRNPILMKACNFNVSI